MAPSYDNHSKVLGGETMAAIVILLAKINQNTFVKPQKITLIIGIGKNTDYYSVVADSWSLIKRLVKFFLKNVNPPNSDCTCRTVDVLSIAKPFF